MKQLLFILLALVVALPSEARRRKAARTVEPPRVAPAEARRLSYFYQEGIKQKLAGNLSEAHDLFQHCLAIDPNDPDALYELGFLKFYLGEDSLGTEILRRVVELAPNNPNYVQSMALAYLTHNKYDQAIPVVEQLAKLQKRRSDVLYQLVELYKLNGQTDKAIQALDRIEVLEGRTLQTSLQKYALYLDKGHKQEAFAVLERLESESPHDLRIPLLLGRKYMEQGQLDQAMACFERVRAVEPTNAELRMAMMDYYTEAGQPERRIQLRDSLLYAPSTPDDLRARLASALLYDLKQEPDSRQRSIQALDTLVAISPTPLMHSLRVTYMMGAQVSPDSIATAMRQLLTVAPDNENALSRLLVYYIEQQDMESVAEICRMGINAHPEKLIYHFYLGVALTQMKNNKQAVEVLQNGLRQAGEQSESGQLSDIYEVLGELYYEQGDTLRAFAAYDSCLVYKDDNAACLNNYAYYLSLRNERLEEAEQMAYRATKLEPLNKTYLDTYAWVLFMQKNYSMAKFYIDRVIPASQPDSVLLADPDIHADVLEHAGDIYALNDNLQQAMRYWSLAMQKGESSAVLQRKLKQKKYIKE